MSYEQDFLRDFEDWVKAQIQVNQLAMATSQQIAEEDNDQRARDAFIRYESKLDAYEFLLGNLIIIIRAKLFMRCQTAYLVAVVIRGRDKQ